MHSNFFSEELVFSSGNTFREDDTASSSTDDELKAFFESNLNSLRGQTRVASLLFGDGDNPLDNLEMTSTQQLKNFIINTILIKGLRGVQLKDELDKIYGPSFLAENGSLVKALLDHEWLQGNVFSDLSIYSNCTNVASSIKNNASKYIVPCKACVECRYNRGDFCSKLDKLIVPTVASIDFKAFAEKNGFGDVKSKKELAVKIKKINNSKFQSNISPSLEKLEGIGGKVSNSSQFLETLNISVDTMDWDAFKSSYSHGNSRTMLKAYISENIKAGSLDYKRMFSSSNITDIKCFLPFLKKIAEKHDQDYSIFTNEISDYFDIEHLEKRYPTEEEANSVDRLVTSAPNEDVLKVNSALNDLSWVNVKEAFLGVNLKKLASFYIDVKRKNNNINLRAMFSGSDTEEVLSLLTSKDKMILANQTDYSSVFGGFMQSSLFKVGKKASMDDIEADFRTLNVQDELSSLKAITKLSAVEFKAGLFNVIRTRDLKKIVNYVHRNKIHSSALVEISGELSMEYPKYKLVCKRLLELLGVTMK